jgi:hypothetical protein
MFDGFGIKLCICSGGTHFSRLFLDHFVTNFVVFLL